MDFFLFFYAKPKCAETFTAAKTQVALNLFSGIEGVAIASDSTIKYAE